MPSLAVIVRAQQLHLTTPWAMCAGCPGGAGDRGAHRPAQPAAAGPPSARRPAEALLCVQNESFPRPDATKPPRPRRYGRSRKTVLRRRRAGIRPDVQRGGGTRCRGRSWRFSRRRPRGDHGAGCRHLARAPRPSAPRGAAIIGDERLKNARAAGRTTRLGRAWTTRRTRTGAWRGRTSRQPSCPRPSPTPAAVCVGVEAAAQVGTPASCT